MELKYIIKSSDKFLSVKNILKSYFQISDRLLLKLKNNNRILLNGSSVFVDFPVKTNDIVSINLDFEEDNSNIVPKEMKLNIIYEDDAFLILSKPSNIAIHPSQLHYNNSLSNGVKFYFDSIDLKRKIRPVNRLDRDTSGIVIFAKNEYVQEFLAKQMNNKTFNKEYIGIVEGILSKKIGTINAPISRKENSIIERCIDEKGNHSITHYEVINEIDNKFSVINFKLETGRTHQIRVHCNYIGHPILGDTLYGNASTYISRQALHCYKMGFVHPITRKYIEFVDELPNDMNKIIKPKYF